MLQKEKKIKIKEKKNESTKKSTSGTVCYISYIVSTRTEEEKNNTSHYL